MKIRNEMNSKPAWGKKEEDTPNRPELFIYILE